MLLLCLGPILSRPLDPGRVEEEAPGLPVPLEARKNQCICVCWVSAAEEVPLGVEGYKDEVDGSRVKDDMEVLGRGVRSELSCGCDSAA